MKAIQWRFLCATNQQQHASPTPTYTHTKQKTQDRRFAFGYRAPRHAPSSVWSTEDQPQPRPFRWGKRDWGGANETMSSVPPGFKTRYISARYTCTCANPSSEHMSESSSPARVNTSVRMQKPQPTNQPTNHVETISSDHRACYATFVNDEVKAIVRQSHRTVGGVKHSDCRSKHMGVDTPQCQRGCAHAKTQRNMSTLHSAGYKTYTPSPCIHYIGRSFVTRPRWRCLYWRCSGTRFRTAVR